MRVLGKPLTETAPGRLEWLRWVWPLCSSCLLRLDKTCKNHSHNHIHNPQRNNSSRASSLMSRPAPLCPCPHIRPLFFQAGQTPTWGEETVKLLLSKAPVVSCISHWSAHKWSAAIDPLVFLINGLSLWETTGFSSPIRTLWWIYNSTAGLWLHQCLFSLFSPPKLYKCGHKKTVPVLDNNFLRFLLFHSAENKDACISYEIFAQRFKVLTVIAIDLHFDDSLGLPCGVGFDEYVSIRCGTSALYAVDG